MKKTIILAILFTFLLILPSSALLFDGEDCLNHEECESDICQGGKCRAIDIVSLIEEVQEQTEGTILTAESCIESWTCSEWSTCVNQIQTKTCTDVNNCQNTPILVPKPQETQTCISLPHATCDDGIKNQGETGIDCGGPCNICATCYDQIENCHEGTCETGVDCGGSCLPCVLEEASKSSSFWVIFISVLLIIILLLMGLWYFKLRKGAEKIGVKINNITKQKPRYPRKRPPTQPSSLLRI